VTHTPAVSETDRRAFREHGVVALRGVLPLDVVGALDAPVARVGAANGISPQAESLEKAFLPHAEDIVAAVNGLI
jgi:pyruvate/2-oxoglutarate/acetoin dehydrogenase E1 component